MSCMSSPNGWRSRLNNEPKWYVKLGENADGKWLDAIL